MQKDWTPPEGEDLDVHLEMAREHVVEAMGVAPKGRPQVWAAMVALVAAAEEADRVLNKIELEFAEAISRAEMAQKQSGKVNVPPKRPNRLGVLRRRVTQIRTLLDGAPATAGALVIDAHTALALAAQQTMAAQPDTPEF